MRSVDLELDQFVAEDADGPGGVDLRDDRVALRGGHLEHAVSGVVGSGVVGVALLVPAGGDVRDGLARDGVDLADDALEHVVPVAEHVRGHAAAIFLAVVPRGALSGLVVAFEDPVAELATQGDDAAEEALVHQTTELHQARQVELVVHDAGGHAGLDADPGEVDGLGEGLRRRLLGVDVLAGAHRLGERLVAQARHRGVEDDVGCRVVDRGIQVGGPVLNPVLLGQGLDLLGVAADQDGLNLELGAVGEGDAALVADRQDRAEKVLAISHPAGDAVHGDTKGAGHSRLRCYVVGEALSTIAAEGVGVNR